MPISQVTDLHAGWEVIGWFLQLFKSQTTGVSNLKLKTET